MKGMIVLTLRREVVVVLIGTCLSDFVFPAVDDAP